MTGRYHWSEDPIRHLDDWADSSDDHTVDYAEVTNGHGRTVRWICTASDLEPCGRRKVRILIHGNGTTRAAAADQCLTHLAEHSLERARAHLKSTQPTGDIPCP